MPKITIHPACVTSSLWKYKNLSSSSSDLSLVNYLVYRALQLKLYRQEIRMLIIWSAFCYPAGSDTPGRNKRGTRQTAKKRDNGGLRYAVL